MSDQKHPNAYAAWRATMQERFLNSEQPHPPAPTNTTEPIFLYHDGTAWKTSIGQHETDDLQSILTALLDKGGHYEIRETLPESVQMLQEQIAAAPAAKQAKLFHYSERPLTLFTQIDLWLMEPGDSYMTSDSDGVVITTSDTAECMHGAPIRLLIQDGIKKKDVLRMLKKARQTIKSYNCKTLNVDEVNAIGPLLHENDEQEEIPF